MRSQIFGEFPMFQRFFLLKNERTDELNKENTEEMGHVILHSTYSQSYQSGITKRENIQLQPLDFISTGILLHTTANGM